MKARIENLQKVIGDTFFNDDTILYIFYSSKLALPVLLIQCHINIYYGTEEIKSKKNITEGEKKIFDKYEKLEAK